MKICPTCSSSAFDDMPVCYGCLQPFHDAGQALSLYSGQIDDSEDDLMVDFVVEEPSGRASLSPQASTVTHEARFHVTISELFGYDIYLLKEEGSELTIGCARDNNIVLPHTESQRHVVRLYYSQGEVWAQDRGSLQKASINDTPLTGTRCLKEGAILQIGEARIELIAECGRCPEIKQNEPSSI